MARTKGQWLNKHIAAAEDLLENLYRERDARTVAEMEEPQVVTEMGKLKASVHARRRYETKILCDPLLLEAHRKRSRVAWQAKQSILKAEAEVEAAVEAERRKGEAVAGEVEGRKAAKHKTMSFTLTL
jgi:hypothetical protein